MPQHIRVFEEKKKPVAVWVWLLPLILLAIAAFFLVHRRPGSNAGASTAAQTAPGAFPDLGTVHFDTDKASLTPDGQATLQRAAAAMKANPGAHLRIEGYTDSTGAPARNADLSAQRAQAVAAFIEVQGIDRSRLTGGGFGSSNPVDSNETQNGKADNRRVELFSQQ